MHLTVFHSYLTVFHPIALGQAYAQAGTYVLAENLCAGQDIRVLARTYMSWPEHICHGQDIYVLAKILGKILDKIWAKTLADIVSCV